MPQLNLNDLLEVSLDDRNINELSKKQRAAINTHEKWTLKSHANRLKGAQNFSTLGAALKNGEGQFKKDKNIKKEKSSPIIYSSKLDRKRNSEDGVRKKAFKLKSNRVDGNETEKMSGA